MSSIFQNYESNILCLKYQKSTHKEKGVKKLKFVEELSSFVIVLLLYEKMSIYT